MSGALTVLCPSCGTTGQVPLNFLGHLIHCKHCDKHFPVLAESPTPTPAPAKSATPASLFEVNDDDIALAPMDPEEEKHLREHYEARVRHMLAAGNMI